MGCVMSKQWGFTLVEVMVSIAVIAVIVVFAFPAMQLMQANSRMASVANDLAADLKNARSRAIVTRSNITFSANTGGWSNGWSASFQVNQSDSSNQKVSVLVLEKLQLPAGISVTQSVSPLTFNGATGRVADSSNASVDVVFRVCDTKISKETGSNVLLNRFGRVLIQRHNDDSTCNQ